MRTKKNDNNSFSPYKYNKDVEDVVKQAHLKFLSFRIDNALDEGIWFTNPDEFQKLVDAYLEAKKSVDKSYKS